MGSNVGCRWCFGGDGEARGSLTGLKRGRLKTELSDGEGSGYRSRLSVDEASVVLGGAPAVAGLRICSCVAEGAADAPFHPSRAVPPACGTYEQ